MLTSAHMNDTVQINILSHVSAVLDPGKTYLVLGPPRSSKTSFLKAVACEWLGWASINHA